MEKEGASLIEAVALNTVSAVLLAQFSICFLLDTQTHWMTPGLSTYVTAHAQQSVTSWDPA
jgi:hypothetical protein